MIEYRHLYWEDTEVYIHSNRFKSDPHLILSYPRYLSYKNNPRLRPDWPVITIAEENDIIVAYRSMLHDEIQVGDTIIPFSWFSGIWVHPEYRGRNLSVELYRRACIASRESIIATEFVPHMEHQFNKTKLFHPKAIEKNGIRLYLRSNLQGILPPKGRFFRQIKPGLKVIDSLINAVLPSDNNHRIEAPYSIQRIHRIDSEVADFIRKYNSENLFKRDQKELNWILNYPWIIPESKNNHRNERYYFSTIDNDFQNLLFISRKDGKNISAFMFFTIRNKHLKLQYLYEEDDSENVFQCLLSVISSHDLHTFSSFEPRFLRLCEKKNLPGLFKKSITRKYMISKRLKEKLNQVDFHVQTGDGDCVFT